MRTLKTLSWLLTLGFVLVLDFGVMLHAQDNANCTTTSRVETYRDHQGKVQFQKVEIKSAIPGRLLIAVYSHTSPTPITLKKFWELRRKGYLACAAYYENIEKLRAGEEGSGSEPANILAILPSSDRTPLADGTDSSKNSVLVSHGRADGQP